MNIMNDAEFKAALGRLTPQQQRIAAASFVDSVLALSHDPRVVAAVAAAQRPEVSEVELQMQHHSAKAAAVASYTQCGHQCDWLGQAGHFVAKAAEACVEPMQERGAHHAWETAMRARMARTCEAIGLGQGTDNSEAEVQYRILDTFINS
jgi:hypothetical protein